jgi:hypothetical protein
MPDDDLWPNYPCTRPDLFAPDVPALQATQRIFERICADEGMTMQAVLEKYSLPMLSCRRPEGTA